MPVKNRAMIIDMLIAQESDEATERSQEPNAVISYFGYLGKFVFLNTKEQTSPMAIPITMEPNDM